MAVVPVTALVRGGDYPGTSVAAREGLLAIVPLGFKVEWVTDPYVPILIAPSTFMYFEMERGARVPTVDAGEVNVEVLLCFSVPLFAPLWAAVTMVDA